MNKYCHKIIFFTAAVSLLLCSVVSVAEDASAGEALITLESNIIGDKEQPSVSYFIPWKGTGGPDGLRLDVERKNDDTLGLVDRNILLRSMSIYNEMSFEGL